MWVQGAGYALDCQGGGDGYPGDQTKKWVGLVGKNAGKKI